MGPDFQPQMDFTPPGAQNPNFADISLTVIAEQTITRALMDGIEHMNDEGLRLIRYMLSISRSARFGFLPNFSDADACRQVARQFIRYCGGAALAMHTMHRVCESES